MRAGAAASTTPCGRRSTTARSRPASRPARSPTSRFLSFFPILALAFFVVGWIAKVYPDAQDTSTDAINSVMPGLIGTGEGQIQLDDIQDAAATVGIDRLPWCCSTPGSAGCPACATP